MADTVREMGAKCRNWSRWGPNDELGTLNYIAPETIVRATRAVRRGVTFSLAIPFDNTGPQINQPRRFNPIHRMILTGPDFTTGAFKRPGGVGFADDMVIMALQCGTQWDALSHCFLDGRLYNGYDANLVSSEGAKKNGMEKMARFVATRGVLLDLPRVKGVDWLEPGYAITADDLEAAAKAHSVTIGRGDALLVRTGQRVGDWHPEHGQHGVLGMRLTDFDRRRSTITVRLKGARDEHRVPVTGDFWPVFDRYLAEERGDPPTDAAWVGHRRGAGKPLRYSAFEAALRSMSSGMPVMCDD